MKMAKKLLAVLLAGVLALSVLSACSGGAGPLTKDNVSDYMQDMAKLMGYNYTANQEMAAAAQNAMTYLSDTASTDSYKSMDAAKAIRKIVENDEGGIAKAIGTNDEYYYFLSFAVVDSYRTDLFNQGQTAIVAGTLMTGIQEISEGAQPVESEDEEDVSVWFGVAEGTINGKKCMVAVYKSDSDYVPGAGGAVSDDHTPNNGNGESSSASNPSGAEG